MSRPNARIVLFLLIARRRNGLNDDTKGHGGADVALRLQKILHHRVLQNASFPSNIPQASKWLLQEVYSSV